MITKNDILNQLESFRYAVGHPVIVHTSLRAIGPIDGGADTLLDALIEFFTAGSGLLCIPTHTWDESVMDLRNPRSCIGTLPTVAAKRHDGIRTLNPTHSMMIFGNKRSAIELAECDIHINSPASPMGSMGKVHDMNGFVLLLGVGHESNTFLHCVEEMMQVPGRLTDYMVERTIIHRDGHSEIRKLYWFNEAYIPDVSIYFPKYEPAFRYHKCIYDGMIGNASAQMCSTQGMRKVMELIRNNSHGKEILNDDAPLPCHLFK